MLWDCKIIAFNLCEINPYNSYRIPSALKSPSANKLPSAFSVQNTVVVCDKHKIHKKVYVILNVQLICKNEWSNINLKSIMITAIYLMILCFLLFYIDVKNPNDNIVSTENLYKVIFSGKTVQYKWFLIILRNNYNYAWWVSCTSSLTEIAINIMIEKLGLQNLNNFLILWYYTADTITNCYTLNIVLFNCSVFRSVKFNKPFILENTSLFIWENKNLL